MPYEKLIQSHIRIAEGLERMARTIRRKVNQQILPETKLEMAMGFEEDAFAHRRKASLFGSQFVSVK